MKNSHIIGVIVLIILGVALFYIIGKGAENTNVPPVQDEQTNGDVASIEGCYIAGTSQDVYTLNVADQDGEDISGSLAFKNFEKDSSSGTFKGTYENGILLGDYSFRSEGTDSKMQVIFKKVGNDFVRGYGDLDSTGTIFTDLDNITFDSSSTLSVFKKGTCS